MQRLREALVPQLRYDDERRRPLRTLQFKEYQTRSQMLRTSENLKIHAFFLGSLVAAFIGFSACQDRGTLNPEIRDPIKTSPVASEVPPGRLRVVRIIDGDTIEVLDESKRPIRVRLAGIDAPEKGQPFSKVAKDVLGQLVRDQTVVLEGTKTDRWDRRVAKVVTDRDVCLEMVRRGLAWHFKRYENEQTAADRENYDLAEKRARQERLGNWREAAPVPPWDFREARRNGNRDSKP